MRISNRFSTRVMALITLLLSLQVSAKTYFVESQEQYQNIASELKAGDTVILKNGHWSDFEVLLEGTGTESSPITLKAETKGKVILSGQSNLRLSGQHLVVSGLVFKDGYTPSSAVIDFRKNKAELAFHSRVTEIVIDNYNNPDKRESDYWVALYGRNNRLDHSHFVAKRNKGVTVAVRLNSEQSQKNYHRIDHNYFGYRPTFGSNGGETLRIGTSHYSLSDSFTLVENNIFNQTNGEVEIISVKSGSNTIRGNLFFEAKGTLTLRHGNGNVIEENIFIGNNVEHTGGIRVINKDQVIRHNYLEGLTGYRFGSGFTVMNGVPNSPINRYHQVENAHIANNTFINVEHIQLAAGSDSERSAIPKNSVMVNNLFVNTDGEQPFTAFDDVSGIKFSNNIANTDALSDLAYGIEKRSIELQKANNGLMAAADLAENIGAKPNLHLLHKSEVGVDWYPKLPPIVPFDSGKEIVVSGSATDLLKAIEQASSGDTLILEAGQYDIAKLVKISKVLTLKAQKKNAPHLTFERSALFEIRDGGSLKIDGLTISGANSPDAAGNSVVRTQKWGMVENYRLKMMNSIIKELDINHSFHFFVTGKGAFADDITLVNNQFSDITGDVLQLNTEVEDLGIYNAEYVNLKENSFEDIAGAVIKLYRGGTDESTFGPHLLMTGNSLSNVGFGGRNKSKSSLFLHGVQVTHIEDNNWNTSAPISIEHTVGEPKTKIIANSFTDTGFPEIVELRFKGPHTAVLSENTMKNEKAR